jgi:acyl-CoA reductase-like NAD-dependent aldehyde dehydrogenase
MDGQPSESGLFIEPTVLRVDGLDAARKITAVTRETFFPLLPVVIPERADDRALLDTAIEFLNANEYGLRNSLWATDESVIEEFAHRVHNGGLLKINDSHVGLPPYLAPNGGNGLTGGPFGESNYPMLRTTHMQGISIGTGIDPRLTINDMFDPERYTPQPRTPEREAVQ